MKTKYLVIENEVARTRRRLNLVRGMRLGLTCSGSVTLIYLIAYLFGWLPMIEPWLLVLFFNVFAAGVGLIWGDLLPARLQNDLLRVDRALGLGEKLTTIYDLRRSEQHTSEILEALYRRIGQTPIEVDQVFALSKRDRQGWFALTGICAGLLLVGSLMINGLSPQSLEQWLQSLPLSDAIKEQLAISQSQQNSPDGSAQESSSQLGDRNDSNKINKTCDPARDPGSKECMDQESRDSSMGAASQGRQGMPQNFPQTLADLLDQLQHGQITPDQLREELRGLADQLPPGLLQDMLEDAVNTTDPQELAERLRDALREAQRQQENQKRRADAQEEGGDSVGSPGGGRNSGLAGKSGSEESSNQNSDGSQTANNNQAQSETPSDANNSDQSSQDADELKGEKGGSSGQGQNSSEEGGDSLSGGDGKGEPTDQQPDSGDSAGGNSETQSDEGGQGNTGNPEGEQSGQRSAGERSQGGGENPGDGPGDGREGGPGSDPAAFERSLLIRSGNLPKDVQILQKLITLGLPVDLEGAQGEGPAAIKLNMDRVESLLELRELPPNLRALVRTYFLSIAGEKRK